MDAVHDYPFEAQLYNRSSNQSRKHKAGHYYRRCLFYFHLLYFCVVTIKTAPEPCTPELGCTSLITNLTFWFWAVHTLWWEVELQHKLHGVWCVIFHGASFAGSWVVAGLVTCLFIYKPNFMALHAAHEGVPVAVVWFFSIVAHYLPPLFHLVDMKLSFEHLKHHHNFQPRFNGRIQHWHMAKPLWFFAAPCIVMGAWLAVGFSTLMVYAVDIPLGLTMAIATILDLAATVFFFWYTKVEDGIKYSPLNAGV